MKRLLFSIRDGDTGIILELNGEKLSVSVEGVLSREAWIHPEVEDVYVSLLKDPCSNHWYEKVSVGAFATKSINDLISHS